MSGRLKKKLVFMVLASALLLIALSPMALGGTPPSIEWSQDFGGAGYEFGKSVQETSDGGYIVAGSMAITINDSWNDQVYLVKTDAKGSRIWEKDFGGRDSEQGNSVQETSDGGYIVAGITAITINNSWNPQVYLVKTDAKGNKIWEKDFGGAGSEYGNSVQETSDGGYIVAGGRYITINDSWNPQVYLVKTDAKGNKIWEKDFGEADYEFGNSVQETSDGGYIVAGYTYSYGNLSQIYLVKTDADGNKIWEKDIGGADYEFGNSVQETPDGGYIVAGSKTITTNDSWNPQVYLVKTDAKGNKIWEKDFGGAGSEDGSSVQETSDGGYIVAGGRYITINDSWNPQVYLVKTDAKGNKIWEKDIGGADYEYSYSVQETSDGGYIVAGETGHGNMLSYPALASASVDYRVSSETNETNEQVYLVKLNYIKTEWAKNYGGSGDDSSSLVQRTSDGGYVVAGHTTSFGNGDQAYLLKADADGDKIWEKDFGGVGSDDGRSVQRTSEGGYILAGTTESFGNGSQVYLIKTYDNGSEIWEKAYGGKDDEEGYSIQQTSDGGYIAAGTTTSFGNGNQVYLVKTDVRGNKTWEKDFGGPEDEGGYSVQQVPGGYVVAGYTTSFGKRYQVYLLKTDTSGNKIWENNFGGMEDEWGYSVQQISDGYVVAGYTTSSDKRYQAYLLKTSTGGNKIWEKDFGGKEEERAYSVQQTPDGGYIAVGYATPYFNGSQVYIVKTDANGTEQWYYRFGGAGDEGAMSIINTADGNYTVAGATNSFGDGDQVYLAKLVNLGVDEHLQSPQKQIASNNSVKSSTGSRTNHLKPKRPMPPAKPVKQPRIPRARPQRTSIS